MPLIAVAVLMAWFGLLDRDARQDEDGDGKETQTEQEQSVMKTVQDFKVFSFFQSPLTLFMHY